MRSLIFFLFATCFVFELHSATKVLIDAGHGGVDHGAVKNYAREADITLKVSKILVNMLKDDGSFLPSISRSNDKTLGLKERAELAHKVGAEIFVSVHANSSPSPKVRGVEIYFQNTLQPDQYSLFLANRENEGEASMRGQRPSIYKGKSYPDEVANILDDMARTRYIDKSYELAVRIKESWQESMGSKSQKIRQAPFYVVSSVNMPSVLVEIGYLTNPKEAKRLSSDYYQKRVAESIFKGIKAFRDGEEK